VKPIDSCGVRKVAESDPQRVVALELVVPVRHEQQATGSFQPPAQQPDDVQRRLVGPMDVLHDDDERLAAQLEQCGGNLVRRAVRAENDSWPGLRDLQERSERTWSGDRVAGTTQDGKARRKLVAEPANERCLADACLAGDENEATGAAVRRRERGRERLEQRFALEQARSRRRRRHRHARIVLRPAPKVAAAPRLRSRPESEAKGAWTWPLSR
jgi:hypothetical protein